MFKKVSISKTIDYIILFALAICIIYSFLLCGSPLNNNVSIIHILLNITAISSIFINRFVYHKKIMFSKYDILFLCISMLYLLPIVFQTYASISDTFDYLLRYISLLCIYLILKNLDCNSHVVFVILHSIIIGVIGTILLGIDDMSTCFFEPVHRFLNTYASSASSLIRLDSVFQYPNAFASSVVFSCFLTLGLFFKTEQKYRKGIYAGLIQIQVIALILSGSRLNIAIFLFGILLFLFLLKKKQFALDLLFLSIPLFFTTLFYCSNYLTWINHQQYVLVWGILLLEFLFIFLIEIFIFSYLKINISIKKIIVLFFIGLFLCVVLFFILLQIPDSLTLFNTPTSSRTTTIKQINYIKPNEKYTFEFNIESTSSGKENYHIMIFELNDSLKDLKVHRISFDEFKGIKTYSFITTENTKIIKIACKVNTINENTKLTIHECFMNQSKLLINYKYLPTNFIFRMFHIFSGDNSMQERFIFIKDGITIGMQHFFTGSGANGWKYNFKDIQTSDYYTTEVHSYPIQLFIETGFFGIILFILLCMNIGIDSYRFLRSENQGVFIKASLCALLSLFLHSCIDFDMSFFSILLACYTVIFLLVPFFKHITLWQIKKKVIYYGISLLLLIALVYCLLLNIGNFLSDTSNINSLELSEKVLTFNPYNKEARAIQLSAQMNSQLLGNTSKDLELFIKYEPKNPNIDYLKLSYVSTLLNHLTQDNLQNTVKKIEKISYSSHHLNQSIFQQEILQILNLIKEKSSLFSDDSLTSLYHEYTSLLY